jgi:hypothetical protein
MPADPRKRQKKLERLKAKRKAKQHQLTREKSAGLPERLAAAANYPVLQSWVTMPLWKEGMGSVSLSRQLPNGQVAFAVFLVDRYCLGVKDAFADVSSRQQYEDRIVRKTRAQFSVQELSPAAARKLVESAVEYAKGLGFPPHPDYQRAKLIFGGIDPTECKEEFEFGKDGKPLFIAGPHDGPQRCQQILKTLERTCGPGNFDFVLPMGGPIDMVPGDEGAGLLGLEDMDDEWDESDFDDEDES